MKISFLKYSIILIFFSFLNILKAELLTLEESIRIALENNYSIKIYKGYKQINENNHSIGNAGFLPSLDISGRINSANENVRQEYLDGRVVNRTGAVTDQTAAQVDLNWTIFDGGRMFIAYERFAEYKNLSLLDLKLAIETIVADVIINYNRIIMQQKLITVANENIEVSEERLRISEEKYNIGSASRLEMLQAKVDLNADKAYLMEQTNLLNNYKIEFNEILARTKTIDFNTSDEINYSQDLVSDVLIENALNNNITLKKLQTTKNITNLDLNEIRSEYYPNFGLFANYRYNKSESEAGFQQSNRLHGYTYGITMSMNLFNGLNTKRRIENFKIENHLNEIEIKKIENELQSSLLQLYNEYKKNIAVVELETENTDVSRENMEIAIEQLRLGRYSPLEVREAQRSYVTAQSRLLNAIFRAKESENELLRLSGLLIEEYYTNE